MSDRGVRFDRRRCVILGLGLGAAGVLAGCATIVPRSIDISAAQLLDALGRQFPLNLRGLDALELMVATPRVRFLPQENRLGTELDLRVGEGWLARAVQGTIGFTYGLRYEPSDRSIRMTDLRVERLEAGAYSLSQSRGSRLAAALAQQLLRDVTVYRLQPEQVDLLQRLRVQPGPVRVLPQGLAVELRPMG
ncbi:MAG: hypothetical protein AB1666_01070 [Pseudomonadota bacterium]|uniref:DUF1439 domain-containing protein n=1 Tax=Caldimonas aquatica TaxID=376175 RepID=A0ABY6MVM0_9BURK|nr:hypothetical protein [Schlegelella aquatica]UZD56063.1 hypothetical protein OMP39_05660 [Schlegelella aquatica]